MKADAADVVRVDDRHQAVQSGVAGLSHEFGHEFAADSLIASRGVKPYRYLCSDVVSLAVPEVMVGRISAEEPVDLRDQDWSAVIDKVAPPGTAVRHL